MGLNFLCTPSNSGDTGSSRKKLPNYLDTLYKWLYPDPPLISEPEHVKYITPGRIIHTRLGDRKKRKESSECGSKSVTASITKMFLQSFIFNLNNNEDSEEIASVSRLKTELSHTISAETPSTENTRNNRNFARKTSPDRRDGNMVLESEDPSIQSMKVADQLSTMINKLSFDQKRLSRKRITGILNIQFVRENCGPVGQVYHVRKVSRVLRVSHHDFTHPDFDS